MEKRKVLFVVHQLNYGGVQKALISALTALDYSSFDVTLYIRKNRTELLEKVNPNVSRIIVNDDTTHYYRKLIAILLQILIFICEKLRFSEKKELFTKKLNSYLLKKQFEYEKEKFFGDSAHYDVAVAYIQGYPAKFVAECINADKKVVFFHGSEDEKHELHEKVFADFAEIVGVNAGVRDVLKSFYPMYADKMTYIENYVDENEVIEKSKESVIERDAEVPVLCSCGRFTPVKGFDFAIEAARMLKDRGFIFKWYLVGDGPDKEKIEDLIGKNNVSEIFVLTGMQDNPYPFIAASGIFVITSYAEAHPLCIIEAQILCKPVVSTKTVGGRCLVKDGETGILTEMSAQAIANGIEKLLASSELRNSICDNLKKKDYSISREDYKRKWKTLLEVI